MNNDTKPTLDDVRHLTEATLTPTFVGQVLDKDPRTIRRAIADGSIPAIRLGRNLAIPREKFLALFDVA